jgi:predicted RNase H-like HicB family nuclease
MESCYYSLIRRARDGQMVGWIPDLPGITASSQVEDDVIRELTQAARVLLAKMIDKGLSLPKPSPSGELPLGDHFGRYRRLLLVFS